MADLHILREHHLSLAAARKVAHAWAEQGETEFGMACSYEEGKTADTVSFTRSGVSGKLLVDKQHFVLDAKLGFLLGAFKDRIEAEIVKNLDALLARKPEASKPAARKVAPRKGA